MGIKILCAGQDPLFCLSVEHFAEFHAARGVTMAHLEVVSPEELEPLALAEAGVDLVRTTLDLSAEWVAHCPTQPLNVSRLGAADAFFKRDQRWEPELFWERGLHDVIVREGKELDLNEAAYVVGQGATLRVAASVVLGLGFGRVSLVGEDEEDLDAQAKWLRKVYVDAEISPLPASSLTMQTVGASLVVNTVDLSRRPELASDLAYFNFMQRGGLVLDPSASLRDNAMVAEALRAGLRVIPPHEISGADGVLLSARLGLPVDPRAYLNSWFEFLRQRSGDPAGGKQG